MDIDIVGLTGAELLLTTYNNISLHSLAIVIQPRLYFSLGILMMGRPAIHSDFV